MSKEILFLCSPFDKNLLTLALESGVDGIITDTAHVDDVRALARCRVLDKDALTWITLAAKEDEEAAVEALQQGDLAILTSGWEIIPVENILAQSPDLAVEADSLAQARLAAGILESGVKTVVVRPEAAADLKDIVKELKLSQGTCALETAVVTEVRPVGMGHRVCVDTMTLMSTGQGMLVGNSSAFTFLVHAETESNPYVAPRPFRINAGGVHAYTQLPGDRTTYLEELEAGSEVLIVGADGSTTMATVGRCKTEIRPMLLIRAECGDRQGTIFLQNAETIRVVRESGEPVSVVTLEPGDRILCRTDQAGRHFGMRITEEIKE
jgi:3-dehydroquinate synthase II